MRRARWAVADSQKRADKRARDAGFTIVELLISLVIVGILAALAIINMGSAIEKALITRAIADIRTIERQVSIIEIDGAPPPDDLDSIGLGAMRDPWGNPYQYLSFATVKSGLPGKARKDKKLKPLNSTYDLSSMGPDGDSKSPLSAKASQDDVIRAADGAFVGLGSEF